MPISSHNEIRSLESTLDLSVFVPCLNEEGRVGPTLDAITSALAELPYKYEILVVDDGSKDATARVIETYIAEHPDLPIRFRKNPHNFGLSRSYIDAAFEARGKYYRLVSGDNPESKETLLAVFQRLGTADMIIPYFDSVVGKPAFRRALSGLYTGLVNMLSGYNIRYYNGCALHLRYNAMRWGPYSFGFGFQAELITRLLDEGATYVEIPVKNAHVEKAKGNSAINFGNFLSVAHSLLEIFIRRIRKRVFQKV